jgi:hypothetical protein
LFGCAKDKVKPLAVIMDKAGQSVAVSCSREKSTVIVICEHLYGAFTRNILGSDFVRLLLTIHIQNSFFAKEVVCVSIGQPSRCEYVKRYSYPITDMDRPRGFQEVEAPRFENSRHMKVASLSALRTGHLYSPGSIPGTVSVRG